MAWSMTGLLEKSQQVRYPHSMDRAERLKKVQDTFASMPGDIEGDAGEQEIAVLDAMIEKNLTAVQQTK